MNYKKLKRIILHPFYKADEPIKIVMLGHLIAELCPSCGNELTEESNTCEECGLKIIRRV